MREANPGLPEEATPKPCSACPWRLNAAPGWLGPYTPEEWIEMVHSDTAIACHKTIKTDGSWEGTKQCAGAASFREHVGKSPRDPRVVVGPSREGVFTDNEGFIDHHRSTGLFG